MNSNEKINTIVDTVEKEYIRLELAIDSVLRMLFWNNQHHSFANMDERNLIRDYIINKFKYIDYPDGSGYHKFENEDELINLINEIRIKMGLWNTGDNPPIKTNI